MPSRRQFVRVLVAASGGAVVTGASAGSATAKDVVSEQDEVPFGVGTVVAVAGTRVIARENTTGKEFDLTPRDFGPDWVFEPGDEVAIVHRPDGATAEPFLQIVSGRDLMVDGSTVRVGGRSAVVDSKTARSMVAVTRDQLDNGATGVAAGFVRNSKSGRYRCFGIRAEG